MKINKNVSFSILNVLLINFTNLSVLHQQVLFMFFVYKNSLKDTKKKIFKIQIHGILLKWKNIQKRG